MTRNLTKEQVAEITRVFRMFDKRRKGSINASDIAVMLREEQGHDLADDEIQHMVAEIDVKGTGVIEIEDFMSMMARYFAEQSLEEDSVNQFQNFDVEEKGYLTYTDIMAGMAEKGEEITSSDAEGMIRMADADEDGIVGYEDFRALYFHLLEEVLEEEATEGALIHD